MIRFTTHYNDIKFNSSHYKHATTNFKNASFTFVGCEGGITEDWTAELILVGYSTTDSDFTELLAAGVEAFTVSVDEALDATEGTSFVCDVVVTTEDSAEFVESEAVGVRNPTTFFFGGGFLVVGVRSISCKMEMNFHKNTH